jgi:hypothetical protein
MFANAAGLFNSLLVRWPLDQVLFLASVRAAIFAKAPFALAPHAMAPKSAPRCHINLQKIPTSLAFSYLR